MLNADSVCWFVARTRNGQENSIRNALNSLGVDNFIPMRGVMKVVRGKKVRSEAPLIPNMVFIHCRKDEACALANGRGLQLFYVIDRITRSMLVVPDRQMADFIRIVTGEPDNVSVCDFVPSCGQRVRVISGELSGVEGVVVSESRESYLVVSVGNLLCAKLKIPLYQVELI